MTVLHPVWRCEYPRSQSEGVGERAIIFTDKNMFKSIHDSCPLVGYAHVIGDGGG